MLGALGLRQDDAVESRCDDARDVAFGEARVEPIHADRDEAAEKPRQRGLDEPPRRDLGGIRDRVLQVEDDAVGAERGHLVDLARLIAGREEQAPK